MYRDFQSRNVMIKDENRILLISREVVKVLCITMWLHFLAGQSQYSDELREELLQEYLTALQELMPVDEADFRNQLKHYVLFPHFAVLGAYGFRGYFERKTSFSAKYTFCT